jgi:hypothetical protein
MQTRIKEFRARYDQPRKIWQKGWRPQGNNRFSGKGKIQSIAELAYRIAKCLNSTLDELFIFDDSDL